MNCLLSKTSNQLKGDTSNRSFPLPAVSEGSTSQGERKGWETLRTFSTFSRDRGDSSFVRGSGVLSLSPMLVLRSIFLSKPCSGWCLGDRVIRTPIDFSRLQRTGGPPRISLKGDSSVVLNHFPGLLEL